VVAAALLGTGIVCIGLSPGLGWVLIIAGAWFAAHTFERRSSPAHPRHADPPGARERESHCLPPAHRINWDDRRPRGPRPRRRHLTRI
jgi:hypothetical protein